MSFGRVSEQLTKTELSQLLVQYSAIRLGEVELMVSPTQASLAEELGVSQSMVSSVIHGEKHFSRDRFVAYAERIQISLGELLGRLLRIQGNNRSMVELEQLQCAAPEDEVLLCAAELCRKRIYAERYSVARRSEKGFDATEAYFEVLAFAVDCLVRFGVQDLISLALASLDGDDGYIFALAPNSTMPQSCVRFRESLFPQQLLKCFEETDTAVLPTEASFVCLSSLEIQQWSTQIIDAFAVREPAYQEVTFLSYPVFVESGGAIYSGYGGRDMSEKTARKCLVLAYSTSAVGERFNRLVHKVMSQATSLCERVALFGLEDRFRCAKLVITSQVWRDRLYRSEENESADLEGTEFFAERLLERLCGDLLASAGQVLSADIWLYRVATDEFNSPSNSFRKTSELAKKVTLNSGNGEISFDNAYENAFHSGQLQPRRFGGRSSYMIANSVALIKNRNDEDQGHMRWSSASELDCGALVGMPFFFSLNRSSVRHISILFLRFSDDLSLQEGKSVILSVGRLMEDEGLRGRFEPLFGSTSLLSHKECKDREWGTWYDVFQEPSSIRPLGALSMEIGGWPVSGDTAMQFE